MSFCNIVNDINSLVNSYGENLIRQLANQYGFDSQDAINKFIYLETITNVAKPQENEQRKIVPQGSAFEVPLEHHHLFPVAFQKVT